MGLLHFQPKSETPTLMLRLFVLIVTFTLVVIGAPQLEVLGPVFDALRQVPSQSVVIADIAALIVSVPMAFLLVRQPDGWLYTRPSLLMRVLYSAALGFIISALFDLFEVASGYAVTLDGLVIIPLAFVLGELAFQALEALLKRLQREPAGDASLPPGRASQTGTEAGVPRLFVTLPIYAFILVFLPQQEDFRRLERSLLNVSPDIAFTISVAALFVCLILPKLYGAHLKKQAAQTSQDDKKAINMIAIKHAVMMTFVIGLGMAALINTVGHFIGYPPTLGLLILIPVGFVIAEIIYETLNWRLRYGAGSG